MTRMHQNSRNHRKILFSLAIVAVIITAAVTAEHSFGLDLGLGLNQRDTTTTALAASSELKRRDEARDQGHQSNAKSSAMTSPSRQSKQLAAFDKQLRSIDDPASLWVIVNKLRPLNPAAYAPAIRTPAMLLRLNADAPEMRVSVIAIPDLERLNAASKSAGLTMKIASGYRSFGSQASVYDAEVRANGQAQADRQSARPGHSEHQTGLAIDLGPASGECLIAECFGELAEGKWLATNAHTYGFIIRYPPGKESVTGYLYEPWHLRYVGSELAAELHRLGSPTLEEFFGLPAAAMYR